MFSKTKFLLCRRIYDGQKVIDIIKKVTENPYIRGIVAQLNSKDSVKYLWVKKYEIKNLMVT